VLVVTAGAAIGTASALPGLLPADAGSTSLAAARLTWALARTPAMMPARRR